MGTLIKDQKSNNMLSQYPKIKRRRGGGEEGGSAYEVEGKRLWISLICA